MYYVDMDKAFSIRKEYDTTEYDELIEDEIDNRVMNECYIKVLDGYFENINYVNNKLYCTDTNNKVKVIDNVNNTKLDNTQISDFSPLVSYDVEIMYLSKEDFILFKDTTNRVYIYKFDENKVYYATEMKDIFKFYPTEKGMIYVSAKEDKYDIYADDVLRIKELHLLEDYFFVNETNGVESLYFKYNYDNYPVPLDKLFDVSQKIEIE